MGFFDFFTDRTPAEPAEIRLVAFVSGKVQGVGFRWWCAGTAKPLGLTGYAENLDDGRVKVIAEGTAASCARLVDILRGDDTAGRVDEVLVGWEEPSGSFRGFGIREPPQSLFRARRMLSSLRGSTRRAPMLCAG